jgi:hypothetical protein
LDVGNAHLHNHRKTEFLINNWDPGTLWTDFGVHADVSLIVCFHGCLNLNLQLFTSDFPQADIHELLLPDLLHQVIKNHIVMWVNEYLLEVHGEAQGLEIIADIDYQ